MTHFPVWTRVVALPLALTLAQVGLFSVTLHGQQVDALPLEGRVVLRGEPVPDVTVSLHHVTSESSGAIDTRVTDATGRFSFPRAASPESAFAFYFVTAEHNSVTFFGPFVRPDEDPDEYLVEVYDTAATIAEAIRVVARHMVLVPETTGSWEVNEILTVLNPTSTALVPGGSGAAWGFSLPAGVADFEVGPGDVLPHELALMEGRVLHLTPVIPGSRDLFIRYRLRRDGSPATLQIAEPTDSLNVYVRQPSHLTGIRGLQSQRMVDVGEERFLQYTSTAVAPGSTIELRWARPGPPLDPVRTAVFLTVALLSIAAVFAVRNRSSASGS